MSYFNILDKDLDIQKNYFLEASAGTGKTFTIAHIVIRLLLNSEGSTIDNLLVVTFTNAAVKELKNRIRTLIEQSLEILNNQNNHSIPNYLLAILEKGIYSINNAKKKLILALNDFENASITTIHSFCKKSLKEFAFDGSLDILSFNVNTSQLQKSLYNIEQEDSISDLLNSDYYHHNINPKILISGLNNDFKITSSIANEELSSTIIIDFKELEKAVTACLSDITESKIYNIDLLYQDLLSIANQYKGIFHKIPNQNLEVESFLYELSSFLSNTEQTLPIHPIVALFNEDNLSKRKINKTNNYNYPLTISIIVNSLFPLLSKLCNKQLTAFILSQTASDHLLKIKRHEEKFYDYDDLIRETNNLIQKEAFTKNLQEKYHSVLIDEFQDTDQLQWNIFSSIFLSEKFKGNLYLIGDPKQSIYRFRGADLYTYFSAKNLFLNKHSVCSLNVNFRSDPSLISALNDMFLLAPDFITLPKSFEILSYSPVEANYTKTFDQILDNNKPIHIFQVDESLSIAQQEEHLIQMFLKEIQSLLLSQPLISLNNFAVLTRTKKQAQKFIQLSPFPVIYNKQEDLTLSPAFLITQYIIQALNYPSDKQAIINLLTSPLFNTPYENIHKEIALFLDLFSKYNEIALNKGIFTFFLMFIDDHITKILNNENGEDLYEDLEQIFELLASYEIHSSLKDFIFILEQMPKATDESSAAIKKRPKETLQAITLTSIHASKGLEYDIVFALGLLSEKKKRKTAQEHLSHSDKYESAEEQSEQMRLFYVACTRAKRRLYLPIATTTSNTISSQQNVSNIFFKQALKDNPLDKYENKIFTCSQIDSYKQVLHNFTKDLPTKTICFPKTNINIKPSFIESFSSKNKIGHLNSFATEQPINLNNKPLLPTGIATGTTLHHILQHISIEKIKAAKNKKELINDILPLIEGSSLEKYLDILCDIIFRCFHSSFKTSYGPLCLKDVKTSKFLREEFFIFSDAPNKFIQGYMDLIVEFQNKFFIIDWKSNFLGHSLEDYNQSNLKQHIFKQGYHLQADFYKTAFLKYLNLFQCEHKFGSVLFIFLRGLLFSEQSCYEIQ